MNSDGDNNVGRRRFLKRAGAASLAAATVGLAAGKQACRAESDQSVEEYWAKKQQEYEAL